jgi:hypothetical protein
MTLGSVGFTTVADMVAVRERLGGVVTKIRPVALTPGQAEAAMDEVLAMRKYLDGAPILLAQRAAETGGWRSRGASSPAEDLAKRSGTSTGRAKDVLDTSKKVDDQPEVEDALREGRLSGDQASLIADAAAANPDAQADLLEEAAKGDTRGLRDRCGRVKAAADPDPEATRRRLHRERYLRYGKTADGSLAGSFKLAPQAGAELDALVGPFVKAQAQRAKADGRLDTLDQLSADALVAMARAAATGTNGTTSTQVNIVVDRDALLRGHTQTGEVCEYTTCFGPISVPVSVVQEILDDAFLIGLFRDGIDVQAEVRYGRHTSVAVRDALRVRDDFTCAIDGCNRRARLEIDHREPVARGGADRYTNLRHLCAHHHHHEKTRADRLFDDSS